MVRTRDGRLFQGVATLGAAKHHDAASAGASSGAAALGGMQPGLRNPLGARALYIHDHGRDTLYRLHGTNEPCVYRKSNPRVVMVKSAQDGVRTDETGSLNRPRIRRIFV